MTEQKLVERTAAAVKRSKEAHLAVLDAEDAWREARNEEREAWTQLRAAQDAEVMALVAVRS